MSTTTAGRFPWAVASRPIAAVLAALLVSACGGEDQPAPDAEPTGKVITVGPAEDGHSHSPGEEHSDQVGDGSRAMAGGFLLADVRLPRAGSTGYLSFHIVGPSDDLVTEYDEEQTKLLHLYVVRTDLAVFRHLHPELDDDGVWKGRVDLEEPGDYRVIAEFTPAGGDPVALGTTVTVPGKWEPADPPSGEDDEVGEDGTVRVEVDGTGEVGDDGRMSIVVSDTAGGPVTLGSYLGTSAHVTGFALDDTRFVHVHPYGSPEETPDGTRLTFHTEFEKAGQYRFFVQVRVGGFLHTIPVTATVED